MSWYYQYVYYYHVRIRECVRSWKCIYVYVCMSRGLMMQLIANDKCSGPRQGQFNIVQIAIDEYIPFEHDHFLSV